MVSGTCIAYQVTRRIEQAERRKNNAGLAFLRKFEPPPWKILRSDFNVAHYFDYEDPKNWLHSHSILESTSHIQVPSMLDVKIRNDRIRSELQSKTLNELSSEYKNIVPAWNWAISQNRLDLVDQSLKSITLFSLLTGQFQFGINCLNNDDDAFKKTVRNSRASLKLSSSLRLLRINVK